jgi:biopolymer transport protein ExbB/TolQ
MFSMTYSFTLVASIQTALNQPAFPGGMVMWGLFMLSILCWVMILSKALFLRRLKLSDQKFSKRLRASRTTLEVFEEGWESEGSAHYQVYLAGAKETAFQLLGSRECQVGVVDLVRGAGLLSEQQTKALRQAFRSGFREAQMRMEQGVAGLRLIGNGAILLGLLGFVWTMMTGFDTATGANEVMPIIGSALGFFAVALMVTAPAIVARGAFLIVLRKRKYDLRKGILVTVSQADKAVVNSDSDEDRDKQDREDNQDDDK